MKLRTFTWLLCACAASSLLAQTSTPSTQQMIEQLKAPQMRGLRNLTVEPVDAVPVPTTASSEAANKPSLSLLIQFDFDSARIKPESQQALTNLAQALQSAELLGSKFAVEGHTDAKGSAAYNLKLSQQRALAVRDFLKLKGVVESRLLASGKGSSDLAISDQPYAAENRRVRIVNLD